MTQSPSLLRGVLIGVGRRSLDDYVPALAHMVNGIELLAACDVDPEAEHRLRDTLQAVSGAPVPKFFVDFRDALDEIEPDIAIVATPHHTHLEIARELLERRIPFLKEKPFAISLPEAHELAGLVERHHGHMRLCLQRRQHPLFMSARQSLAHIGVLRHFQAVYQLNATSYAHGWRAKANTSGGGAIIDMGYHVIDQLHWYFGMPSSVYAVTAPKLIPLGAYEIEETALANLTYPNGQIGSVFLSLCESRKDERFSAYGTDGHLTLDRKSLERFDRHNQLVDRFTHNPASQSAVCDVLFDMVENLADPDIVHEEVARGLAVTTTIDALYRSIEAKRPIDLPCVEAAHV